MSNTTVFSPWIALIECFCLLSAPTVSSISALGHWSTYLLTNAAFIYNRRSKTQTVGQTAPHMSRDFIERFHRPTCNRHHLQHKKRMADVSFAIKKPKIPWTSFTVDVWQLWHAKLNTCRQNIGGPTQPCLTFTSFMINIFAPLLVADWMLG